MTIDSRVTYEVWCALIHDEALADALFEHRHLEAAEKRGFSDEHVAALQHFHDEPGTRWNLENLRFRAALETAAVVQIHLPRTVLLLCEGNELWLQDVCYEYLSHHRWDSFGHARLTECERFAAYTRDRIMKRRATPGYLDAVLELELAVIDVLKRTAEIRPPRPFDGAVDSMVPRLSPLATILEQEVDLRPIWAAEVGTRAEPIAEPVTWLIHVGSLVDGHRMKVIGDGVATILEYCDGARTAGDIARAMSEEYDLPASRVVEIIARCVQERILVAS